MLEANSDHEALMRSKAQAQCLHEICLLYFRVVKGKVGFRLLPLALEGLGEDIPPDQHGHRGGPDRRYARLAGEPSFGASPKGSSPVHSMRALRTLSGPGEHLNIDTDFFSSALLQLMRELSCGSSRDGTTC